MRFSELKCTAKQFKKWSRLLWLRLWTFGSYEIGGISSHSEELLAVGCWLCGANIYHYLGILLRKVRKKVTKTIVVFPEIGLFRPADEGTTVLRNLSKHSLKDSSSLHRRPGSRATQLWRIHVARICLVTGMWEKWHLWFDYSHRTWGLRHQDDSFCGLLCYDAVCFGTVHEYQHFVAHAPWRWRQSTFSKCWCLFFYSLFSEAVSV